MGFEQEIRKSLAGRKEPLVWVYVTFVSKGPDNSWSGSGGGDFMGAVLVEAPNRVGVVDVLFNRHLIPEGAKVGTTIDVPADKVPAEKFRDRLLTRDEVMELWPGVKA